MTAPAPAPSVFAASLARVHRFVLRVCDASHAHVRRRLPSDWIIHQLRGHAIHSGLDLVLASLDGLDISVCVESVLLVDYTSRSTDTSDRVAPPLGVVTPESAVLLLEASPHSDLSSASRVRFGHEIFGSAGARLFDVFDSFSADEFIESASVYGVLLVGPTGSGKSTLLSEICETLNLQPHVIEVSSILSAKPGHHVIEIENMFHQAFFHDRAVIVFKKIEALVPKTKDSTENSANVLFVILKAIRHIRAIQQQSRGTTNKRLLLVGISSSPDNANLPVFDGLFAERIEMSPMTAHSRSLILKKLCAEPLLIDEQSFVTNATVGCSGFTFADMMSLKFPGPITSSSELEHRVSTAAAHISRSAAYVVDVDRGAGIALESVGGMEFAKEIVEESLLWITDRSQVMRAAGIRPCKGILLHGPVGYVLFISPVFRGSGKTMLAKAIATECKANFLAISIPSVVKGYIGDSEKQIARIFAQAKSRSPCIVFIDEIESIFGKNDTDNSSDFSSKIVSQIVHEMDELSFEKSSNGLESAADCSVVVLAATNFPQLIAPELLRPGRIDRLVAVPLPKLAQRCEIFRIYASRDCPHLAANTAWITDWAGKLRGWTGAGISELFRKARISATTRHDSHMTLSASDFDSAYKDMVAMQ
ncbi:hypothetical protein HDU84_000546 [Entophlyctis sp. JEL0112]|nr:hypothetical protein HDU84_000546 [Entophlyctis sp. JEL0112]